MTKEPPRMVDTTFDIPDQSQLEKPKATINLPAKVLSFRLNKLSK